MAITHATSTGPIGETQWLEEHDVDAVALRTALNVEDGATADQSAAEVPVSLEATNYSAATADVEAHLTGINTALAGDQTVNYTGSDGIEVAVTLGSATEATIGIGVNAESMRAHLGIEENAAADQSAAEVPVTAEPANYTAASQNVEAHLAGIDTALATAGGSTPSQDDLLFQLNCSDETNDLTVGEKTSLDVPFDLYLTRVFASVKTAAAGADLQVDVQDNGVSALDAPLAFQATNAETSAFASEEVDPASSHGVHKGDTLSVSVAQVGSTTPGAGLKVFLMGYRDTVPIIPVIPIEDPLAIDWTDAAWVTAGGISPSAVISAHQPSGAPTLAKSYLNIIDPGTGDAVLGSATAPELVAAGWQFDGTKYLIGPMPTHPMTVIARFSDSNSTDTQALYGAQINSTSLHVLRVWNGIKPDVQFTGRSIALNMSRRTAAYVASAHNGASSFIHFDGSYVADSATATATTKPMFIGATNNDGAPGYGFRGTIDAIAFYNVGLSRAQVETVIAAMTTALA